ncbi:hypothetical protein AB838_21205 [Rhodobacteraceae bacterium (ex Bugula neritina AB1)]|nr:hypothetical protein AB838_21205 [Rhodobacteraceae bacterium (ex Bugula neritina AB1)]
MPLTVCQALACQEKRRCAGHGLASFSGRKFRRCDIGMPLQGAVPWAFVLQGLLARGQPGASAPGYAQLRRAIFD